MVTKNSELLALDLSTLDEMKQDFDNAYCLIFKNALKTLEVIVQLKLEAITMCEQENR